MPEYAGAAPCLSVVSQPRHISLAHCPSRRVKYRETNRLEMDSTGGNIW